MVKAIGDDAEIELAVGPVLALVVESITSSLALVKDPKTLVSTDTFAVRPLPLLSPGEATA
jgi:hypothetical protein